MKKLVQLILRNVSGKIIRKYQPQIIGVTGSVGKTSTKEAIFCVLSSKFNVRTNIKNYNNEIGVPLTIIGVQSGGRSIFKWLSVILAAIKLLLIKDKNYPDILVLEMGADKIGDIFYLINFVPCSIGVLTAVSESHLEFFGTIENIIKEKGNIIKFLKEDQFAIVNADDENVAKALSLTKAKIIKYGFSENATVRAMDMQISAGREKPFVEYIEDIKGLSFKLLYNGSSLPVFLNNVLGKQQVYSALAAFAVGISYGLNPIEICESLSHYRPPKGRMNLIAGIKNTLIIDDTYNASPVATVAALEVASLVPLPKESRRFAILGDMLELGVYSEEGHRRVGKKIVEFGFDYLITVGERSRDIIREAGENGMSEDKMYHFNNTDEAADFVEEKIKMGDLILVKGSQGMRMEHVIENIMAEPLRAKELLVRQDAEWQK